MVAVLAITPAARSQTVQYAYDAGGRLVVVADARGDLAVYDYDAVGNLLAIRRIAVADTPEPVVVAVVAPSATRGGATVSVFGKGFPIDPAGVTVTIGGVHAEVVAASAGRLTVRVPAGATSGSVRVTSPLGTASWSERFRVLGTLGIAPAAALVAPGGSIRFTASGEDVGAVRWSVDGIAGGTVDRGTIDGEGTYVAPATPPSGRVRVSAASVDDPSVEATAEVTVLAERPLLVVARPALAVGVAKAGAFAITRAVALRAAPLVLGITPAEATRGARARVSVQGEGLSTATHLEFLLGTEPDRALTAVALTVDADGTRLAADVVVAEAAAVGPRVVRVVTPFGTSGDAALGDNVFTVR
jgi:hypothetical protein